ncbi:hypothetical protein [Shewanella sp. UCD-KL12]|uniref:hypothetical protein n=1 Tax=Shewanella sp. UCD-KL12 TaxID=1917163 RepID=UPI000970F7A5|nr:hypothetical protein [Shewanella sp. UCD-KL12]
MSKSTLISITLVAVAVAGAIGYQSLSSEPKPVEATSASEKPVQASASTAAKPVAPVSMRAPTSDSEPAIVAKSTPAVKELGLSSAQESIPDADSTPSHPPRQAPNANRAPRSAPNSGNEYAHHPRPGTEQAVSAPVSMPAQPPGN